VSLTELRPVNTTGVDGVADENRARPGPHGQLLVRGVENRAPTDSSWSVGWRTGPPRTALGPWGGEPGPHGQLLVLGVENRAPTDSSWSLGWRTGPPRTALGPWGGEPGPHGQLLVRGVETRRRTKA